MIPEPKNPPPSGAFDHRWSTHPPLPTETHDDHVHWGVHPEAAQRIRHAMDEAFETLRGAGHFPIPARIPRHVRAWRAFLRIAASLNHPKFTFDLKDWTIGVMFFEDAWVFSPLPTISISYSLRHGPCRSCGRRHG